MRSRLLLSCVAATLATADETAPDIQQSDANRDMIKLLPADGPDGALGDEANTFGQFVGTWDAEYSFIGKDGNTTRTRDRIVKGWVLDGHALQDLFIGYPTAPGKERFIGATLRYYDKASGKWTITFIAPQFNYVRRLTGGRVGADRIVLFGQDDDGTLLRWSFNDIHPNSFIWRGEKSHDGGRTWTMDEQHSITRRLDVPQRMSRSPVAAGVR